MLHKEDNDSFLERHLVPRQEFVRNDSFLERHWVPRQELVRPEWRTKYLTRVIAYA